MSDTHSLHRKLNVPDGDILIHAGDASRTGTFNEIRAFGRWFRSLPHPLKIFVAGNHDRGFQDFPASARRALGDNSDGLIYLQDMPLASSGIRFWGSPWQPYFNDWAFNLPRDGDEIAEKWSRIPANTDILITHCPPYGVLDRANGEHFGCGRLREQILNLRPRLHIFGHIHEAAGLLQESETTFVNASICDGEYLPVNPIQVLDYTP
jgi:predicted phosphohydrolase